MKQFLVNLKNNNPFLLYLWAKNRQRLGISDLQKNNDKQAIINLYRNFSGKIPDLEYPKTFSEKLQWLKLNNRDERMTVCADKYEVREYLINKKYSGILSNTLAIYSSVAEIDLENLPDKFVIKATHGSGWNLIVNNKHKVNWWIWKKIMNIWLHDNIFWPGREWPYKNMKPRLIVEEYLEEKSGELTDFKFFCFNGKAHFIQANKGRNTNNHAQNFYDLNWKILPFGKDLKPRPDIKINAPVNLNKMIGIAEDLAEPFPFVRVDFYEVNSKIIFGEMTFYPKSGLPDFIPQDYDNVLGNYLTI